MIKPRKIAGILLFGALTVGITQNSQAMPEPTQQEQQEEVTEAQLEKFAKAFINIQTISQEAQPKVAELVQKEGMDIARFSEIYEASMNPEVEVAVNDEEKAKFAKVSAGIEKLQISIQKDMENAIVANGLTTSEYEAIMVELQNSTSLQERLKAKLQ